MCLIREVSPLVRNSKYMEVKQNYCSAVSVSLLGKQPALLNMNCINITKTVPDLKDQNTEECTVLTD